MSLRVQPIYERSFDNVEKTLKNFVLIPTELKRGFALPPNCPDIFQSFSWWLHNHAK